jgi:transposase
MLSFPGSVRIFLAVEPVDMRKSFNGLHAVVTGHLKENPLNGGLYVFINKRRNRLKILFWDGTGLLVLAKRPEKGRFNWPKGLDQKGGKLTIKHAALSMLMEGIDLKEGMQKVWYERQKMLEL